MPMLDSYLFFHGTCAQAMRFYHQTLGGKLQLMMKYGDSPDPHHCPVGDEERIMHTALELDGRMLMASDTPTSQDHEPVGGFSLSLFYDTPEEARRIFEALSAGGQVHMPMGETFWAQAFGMFTDQFGTPWMVSGGSKNASPQ